MPSRFAERLWRPLRILVDESLPLKLALSSSGWMCRWSARTVDGSSAHLSERPRKSPQSRRGPVKINSPLSIEPEARGRSERRTELERHFSGHGRSSVHDTVDNLDVTANVVRELLLRHVEGLEKLLSQDLTRRRRHSSMAHRLESFSGNRRCRHPLDRGRTSERSRATDHSP